MNESKAFRVSYPFMMKQAREKYRVKNLVKVGCIIFAILFVSLAIILFASFAISGFSALSILLSLICALLLSAIYGGPIIIVLLGIYYLISHFVLQDRLFQTSKYYLFERNYMEFQRRNMLLHEEEYQAYLEHINAK